MPPRTRSQTSGKSAERGAKDQPKAKETTANKPTYDIITYKGEIEFGGWKGNVAMMVGFPLLMYYMFVSYKYNNSQFLTPDAGESFLDFLARLGGYVYESAYPTKEAWAIEGGYFIIQLIFAAYLPGGLQTEGVYIPHLKKHLPYYCNAYQALYTSLAMALGLHFSGLFRLPVILERFGEIMSVSIIIGFAFSFYIYFQAFYQKTAVRMSGNHIQDFFLGAPLYPRIGIVDLKLFFEVRLPWFTLIYLALALVLHQYETFGYVSGPAWFTLYATWLYGNACAKGEHLIVPSWDIFYEKFGFMLIFWNISGVPFTYCYNILWLYSHDPSEYTVTQNYQIFLFILLSIAYYFFDTANGQKNSFRLNLQGKLAKRNLFPNLPYTVLEDPEYIKTKNGSTLLTGGWFKYARKTHYTADFIQNLTWALITGGNSPLPYFYPFFFFFMILHRTNRDTEKMEEKYGEDFEEYKRRCPYLFLPWIY